MSQLADPETNLRSLHDLYCRLTGRNLKYQFYMREWRDYAKNFTADDLQAVLAHVDRENQRRERRFQIRTELLRIIGDLAVFDSLRAEAELWQKARAAKARAFRPSPGQVALSEMRHEDLPNGPDNPPKRVSIDFIADSIRKAQ